MSEPNKKRSNEGESMEGPVKKVLRSYEPDLKIVLKYTTKDGKEEEKEYEMYGQQLAGLSNFVDASLAADMKEKATREIVFRDVTPDVFEEALKFLQQPRAIRAFQPSDAVHLATFYDKYEFTAGIGLCDDVLYEHFLSKHKEDAVPCPEDLDFIVGAISLAFQSNLQKTKSSGITFLRSALDIHTGSFVPALFSIEHIRDLHHVFISGELDDKFILQYLTKEKVASPLFPDYFVSTARAISQCTCVELTNVPAGLRGNYTRKSAFRYSHKGTWNAQPAKFVITRGDTNTNGSTDWVIIVVQQGGAGDTVLWKCNNSAGDITPPKGPWTAVNAEATERSTPRLQSWGNSIVL